MKILKILLYIILGLGSMWMILGLFAKKDYHIERSMEIDAPKDLIYEHVRYFKNFESWSPWAKLDPKMKTSITENDGTVGAVYTWAGNKNAGSGKQTLTALTPDRIDIEVSFSEPFESVSPTYLSFSENESKTKVTWAFDMHVAFPWNGLSMFTDMDAAIGKDYEQGLENLKTLCEAMAHKKYRGYEIAEIEIPETLYLGARKTVAFADMPAFYGEQFSKIMGLLQTSGESPAGAPSGLYWKYDEATGTADMAAAIPVATARKFGGGLNLYPLGGKPALLIEYFGAYEKVGEAHFAMDDFMKEKNLQNIPPVIEEYVTDPGQEPDTSKWLTRIIYFVEPVPDSTAMPEADPKQN